MAHLRNAEVTPDTLSSVLGELRFRSAVFARVEVGAPWGIEVPLLGRAMFHFVARGGCTLEVEGATGRSWLSEGDLVIFPHGHRHVMRDADGSPSERIDDLLSKYRIGEDRLLRFGSGVGSTTSLICGGFWFEDKLTLEIPKGLPNVLHLSSGKPGFEWVRLTQELIAQEMSSGKAGTSAIAARLADDVFIEAVRSYFAEVEGHSGQWGSAMQDSPIGFSLTLMQRDLQRAWTVAELAAQVGLSRSAFAARFRSHRGRRVPARRRFGGG